MLASVLALVARAAWGEMPDATAVERVVVTAQRENPAEARAPTSFVSVIDASEHAAEGETVSDALAESVGVQVRRFGGLGAFSTLSIRGSSSNQVQVYLDGIPLSRARNETINLADLPLDSLERIEVYRGTAPVGFSGGGLGGVVNLVTKPPSTTPRTELGVSYGSFDTRKAVASHSRHLRGVDLLAHVTYLGSEGDFRFLDDRGTVENPLDDRRTSRRNNAFDSVEALFKGGHTLSNGLRVDLTSETFFKDQGVPGPGNVQFLDPALREWRALNYLRSGKEGLLDSTLDASATVFGIYERSEFHDPKGDFSRLPQDRRDETTLAGGNLAGVYYPVASHALGWFSEVSHERFAGFDAEAPQPDEPDQTRLHLSLALQDQAAFFTERLLLVPTLRYEHLRDDVSATFDIANRPSAQRERHATDLWSPSLGAQFHLRRWLALRGNLGRFQRAPNFSELFGSRGSVHGNPKLRAEDGIMRDVGFAATHQGGRLTLRLEYAYFNNDIDDIIVLIQSSPNFFTPRNVGGARIRGHEVALHTTLIDHIGLDLNYTHQDAENRSASPNFRGRQLPGRPADEVYARMQFFAAQGELYYEFNLVSGNFTGERNLNRIPTRDVQTLGAVAQIFDRLTLSVEARNLTDNQISDVGGFPLPGRSYFGTVKVRF